MNAVIIAEPCGADMMTADPPIPTDHTDSPYFLLATLHAARKSGDRELERVTRRRLAALGIAISFGDELPPAGQPVTRRYRRPYTIVKTKTKGAGNA